MIEELEWNGQIFAVVIRSGYNEEGLHFVTRENNPLQLGIHKHPRGTKISPHVHKNITKTIDRDQEILHIEFGKVKAEFYENTGKKVRSTILNCGDTILLLSGGHGFSMLEDSKMIEIRQGPYYGVEKDKKRI